MNYIQARVARSLGFPIIVLLAAIMAAMAPAFASHNREAIQRLVVAEARNMGVPPSLALAVAKAESNFDSSAISKKGARGVMQIMPHTAWREYGIDPEQLWQPRLNIRLGLHFLSRLLRRYQGRVDLALSYYNGGSAVGDLPKARIIPATYPYVRKVQRLRLQYRRQVRKGTFDD